MFGFCSRRLQLLFPSCSITVNSVTHYQNRTHFIRLYSSKPLLRSQDEKDCTFTVSYLVNSCGLSPEVAEFLFKKHRVQFESPEKPDSVVKLLKDYGFSNTHISNIVRKLPELLLVNAENTLLPKLEFFASIGITGTDLARTLCGNPIVLKLSLENNIRPCYDLIKSLGIPDGKVPRFIQKSQWKFKVRPLSNVASNVSVLKSLGVPESTVDLCRPQVLVSVTTDAEEFNENVNKVLSMGFAPSSTTFMKALYVLTVMDESKRAQRKEFYKKHGWTEDNLLLAFRKNPFFMSISEDNFLSKMDFLVNKMGLQQADVAAYPSVLNYSLEKWIKPRWSVITVLQSKGLIKKEKFSLLGSALQGKKDWFLYRFVNKYKEQVPELLSIFQGKIGLGELSFRFEERDAVKEM